MKKNSAAGSQPVTRLIWILLTVFFVIIVVHLAKRDFNHDEFEAVHTTAMLSPAITYNLINLRIYLLDCTFQKEKR